jgi:hypothetical protein
MSTEGALDGKPCTVENMASFEVGATEKGEKLWGCTGTSRLFIEKVNRDFYIPRLTSRRILAIRKPPNDEVAM